MDARHATKPHVDGDARRSRRVVHFAPPSVLPIDMVYDANGRICQTTQGTRAQTFGYDAQTGYLVRVTDALSQQTLFERDAVGRTTRQTMPDGEWVDFNYDAKGNMTWLTPPGKPAHGMQYTPVDLLASYDPPVVAGSGTTSTTYNYNLDRQLENMLRPDGLGVTRSYNTTTGRLATVTLPGGTATYGYSATTGKLTSITGPYSVSLAYAYDGSLKTGEIAGTGHWSYDNDFRVVNETVNGGYAAAHAFDNDGIITSAGALTRTPEPASGRLSATALSNVNDSFSYDAYGDLATYDASFQNTSLLAVTYTRDALGRIATKTETTNGETHVYEYHYDLRGRGALLAGVHSTGGRLLQQVLPDCLQHGTELGLDVGSLNSGELDVNIRKR